MSGKKLLFLAISLIILIFDIALSFILNIYSFEIIAQDCLILHIITKCLAILLFVAITIFGILKKDLANFVIQYITTVIFQLVPLAIRYLSSLENGFIISIIVFFITLIIYIGIIGGLFILSTKTANVAKKLEGKVISPNNEDNNANKNHIE